MSPLILIDATTVNRPKEPLTKDRAVSEFLNAVRGLKVGVELKVDELDEKSYMRINWKVTATAVASIKVWLEEVPSPGESLEVFGFRFTVTEWKHGSSMMTTSPSGSKSYYGKCSPGHSVSGFTSLWVTMCSAGMPYSACKRRQRLPRAFNCATVGPIAPCSPGGAPLWN